MSLTPPKFKVGELQETLHALRGHTDEVLYVVFTNDSRRLASASADHTVKIWNIDGQD